jgi:hypothetical protein
MGYGNDAILLVGGYGVVGQQIAECINQLYPDLALLIAGRNPSKGESLVSRFRRADLVAIDVEQPEPLKNLQPRVIVNVVNDPYDHLFLHAAQLGIPYLDITRWTERLRAAAGSPTAKTMQTPVMLSSGWMAGIAAVIAAAAARRLHHVDAIDISILYSLKDKAGPNSAEYMDRLAVPFPVMLDGIQTQVYPFTDPRRVTFPDGRTAKVYRLDTPDQFTLPATTGARGVAARIAFDDKLATMLLVVLTRSGLWKLISGERFTPFRRALLYNPGQGASHQIVIEAAGTDDRGNVKTVRAAIVDPKGQTHMTAVGATIQLARLLGLDGAPSPPPGVVFPDTAPQIDAALATMRCLGVTVDFDLCNSISGLYTCARRSRPLTRNDASFKAKARPAVAASRDSGRCVGLKGVFSWRKK